jgi:hypothetical protein
LNQPGIRKREVDFQLEEEQKNNSYLNGGIYSICGYFDKWWWNRGWNTPARVGKMWFKLFSVILLYRTSEA